MHVTYFRRHSLGGASILHTVHMRHMQYTEENKYLHTVGFGRGMQSTECFLVMSLPSVHLICKFILWTMPVVWKKCKLYAADIFLVPLTTLSIDHTVVASYTVYSHVLHVISNGIVICNMSYRDVSTTGFFSFFFLLLEVDSIDM